MRLYGLATRPLLTEINGVRSMARAALMTLLGGDRQAFLGFLADRFGRRSIFTLALLFYSAASVIMACQTTSGGLCARQNGTDRQAVRTTPMTGRETARQNKSSAMEILEERRSRRDR